MPFLAGVISAFFGWLAGEFAKRYTIGLAAAGAFVVTVLAAFAAVKAAMMAVAAGLGYIVPPPIIQAAGYFLPDNLSVFLTAIVLADTIALPFDYWRLTLGVAVQLAKG